MSGRMCTNRAMAALLAGLLTVTSPLIVRASPLPPTDPATGNDPAHELDRDATALQPEKTPEPTPGPLEPEKPLSDVERLKRELDALTPEQLRREPDRRALALYELAAAHDAAYERDADLEHLRAARAALVTLIEETELHGYAAALVDQALAARARIDDRLLAAQSTVRRPNRGAPSTTNDHPGSRRAGRGWRITGWSMLGLGFATSSVAFVGLGLGTRASTMVAATTLPSSEPARIDAIERGRRSNRIALGGAIASASLLTLGLVALVVGVAIRRKARPAYSGAPR